MAASRKEALLDCEGHPERPRSPREVQKRLQEQVLISCCIMFAEGFYATQVFPYGPWMTEVLRGSSQQVGLYTGFVYTAQSFGMLISAYFWASVSNRRGRRFCLLLGLSWNAVGTVILAFSENYWVTVFGRLSSGLMNSNLSIMRTALRETFQHYRAEDTRAFSTLSVAFGASTVCGPSLGGLLYGKLASSNDGWMRPWSVAMLTCTTLYIITILATTAFLRETAFLADRPTQSAPSSPDVNRSKTGGNSLLRDLPFLMLLALGGGHSYIFTGWEVTYPLLARLPAGIAGEEWSAAEIGLTFLVGSCGLMLYSLFGFPRIAKLLPTIRLWMFSWAMPLVVFPIFPRLVTWACSSGLSGQSKLVAAVNYGAQLVISMFLGSGFITVQLLLNTYVSGLANAKSALAIANSMMVSTQALVRAAAPMANGALFTLGLQYEAESSFVSRSLPFDSMVLISLFCCVISAAVFERLTARQ